MSYPNTQNSKDLQQISPLWKSVRGIVLKTIVVAVVLAGLIAAASALFASFGEIHVKALSTIILVIVLSFLTWFDAEVSVNKGNNFALAGLFSSLFLLIVGLYKIWVQDYFVNISDYYFLVVISKFFELLWILVILRLSLLTGSWLVNTTKKYETVAIKVASVGTLTLISVNAFLFIIPLVFSHINYNDFYVRLMWAFAILTVVGCAIVPLCVALFGPPRIKNSQQPRYVNYGYNQYTSGVNHVNESDTQNSQQPYYNPQQTPIGLYNPNNTPQTPQTRFDGVYEPPRPPLPQPAQTPQNAVQQPAVPQRKLAWPVYEDGTPLPAKPDGTPDYNGIF